MTYEQAAKIALRELGLSQEEIKRRLSNATRQALGVTGSIRGIKQDIPPEQERKVVEDIKELYSFLHSISAEENDLIEEQLYNQFGTQKGN